MPGTARRMAAALVAAATGLALGVAAPAADAYQVNQVNQVNDYCLGQCHDILPPGENGNATLADILSHKLFGTRAGTEFGAGYAAAQDRLWLMDVFRHVGRGQLSGFAGGASANRQLEQEFWAAAPYTEDDLRNQVSAIANSGPAGAQALADINA